MSKKKRILIPLFFSFPVLLFIISFNIKKSYSEPADLSGFELAKDHFKKGFIQFNRMRYLSAVEFFRNAVSVYPCGVNLLFSASFITIDPIDTVAKKPPANRIAPIIITILFCLR